MFSKSIIAIFSAASLLFKSRRALALMLTAYTGLLIAVYLFVSTREATIFQLILTLALVVVAPALFFVLQAASVSYTNNAGGLIRKVSSDCLKLIVVSLPLIAVTLLALYGLNKLDIHPTTITTLRYLLLGVAAPLLAIHLWVAASTGGLRSLLTSLRKVISKTFTPQSVFIYAIGFLIFAVAPYFLLIKTIPSQRAWLELSLLILRLTASALLILLGWVTTVGAISILSRSNHSGRLSTKSQFLQVTKE